MMETFLFLVGETRNQKGTIIISSINYTAIKLYTEIMESRSLNWNSNQCILPLFCPSVATLKTT